MGEKENAIQKAVLDLLKRKGIMACRHNRGGTYRRGHYYKFGGWDGSLDIQMILPDGKSGWIETKTPIGKLSGDQKLFIKNVRGTKGIAFQVVSAGHAERKLRYYGY